MTIRQESPLPATVSGPDQERAAADSPQSKAAPSSKVWQRPLLTVYGDVRELTMGTSPATGESGNPLNFRT